VGPMLFSLYASFTKYNIVAAPRWIGLDNYRNIFLYDDRFRISLQNTVFYVIIKTPVVIVVSLLLAMLLNIDHLLELDAWFAGKLREAGATGPGSPRR